MPEESSSRRRSRSPSHNFEEEASAAVWKRRFYESQEKNNQNQHKKRKSDNPPTACQLGRGLRRMIFLCGEIRDLVSDSDKYSTYRANPDDPDIEADFEGLKDNEVKDKKLSWKRCHTAVKELDNVIPGFVNKIDEGLPNELSLFYAELQHGADNARTDDLHQIRFSIAKWLNAAEPAPVPLLNLESREDRGIAHDTTGRLLCPAELNWDDLVIRAKIRAGDEEYDWLSSFHSRCFYAKYEADPKNLESGYLKSILLVKVYKAIFTAPSSAENVSEEDNNENMPPAKLQKILNSKKAVRRNVASKVHLNNKVTPRSLAYAAVQLHFNLQTAESWGVFYGGFDYQGLYDYVVDFFEDAPGPAAKKRAADLLNWWSMKVFPAANLRRKSNVSASRQELKRQHAALEGGATN